MAILARQMRMAQVAYPPLVNRDDIQIIAAPGHGIPMVISTDAHSPTGRDLMEYGLDVARRAALEKNHVANTKTWKQFQKLLK